MRGTLINKGRTGGTRRLLEGLSCQIIISERPADTTSYSSNSIKRKMPFGRFDDPGNEQIEYPQ